MLTLENPTPGLLFFSFLYRCDSFKEEDFRARVEDVYGTLFSKTPSFNPLIDYYAKEMGEAGDLHRIFFVTTTSYPREFLLTSKLLALEWEKEWSKDGKRMVNVDTGLLCAENFILATTKNYSHRLYLGQKIFADLTYQFFEGKFQTLPWTYPDYHDEEKLEFFSWCRSFLLMQSKA